MLRTCADDLPPRQASLPGAPGPAAARKRATRAVFFPRPEGRGFYRCPAEQDPCRARLLRMVGGVVLAAAPNQAKRGIEWATGHGHSRGLVLGARRREQRLFV